MPILSENAAFIYPMLARVNPASIEPTAEAAVLWIRNRFGRNITPGERTQVFSGMNDPFVWLNDPPVESIDEVRINGQVLANHEQWIQFLPNGQVNFRQASWPFGVNGGEMLSAGRFWNQLPGFPPGANNIEIDYTSAGMTQAEIDNYVGCVVSWWIDANPRSFVAASESIGKRSYAIAQSQGVPNHVTQILSALIPKRFA